MQLKNLTSRSVFDRTMDNLAWGWKRISPLDDGRSIVLRPDLPESDIKVLRKHMQNCLETKGGEVTARVRAADLGRAYLGLNNQGRYRFLKLIADDFGINKDQLRSTMENYLGTSNKSETDSELAENDIDTDSDLLLDEMRSQLRPPWVKLFTQFNALPSGVKFLVDMRADLVRFSRQLPGLDALNRDLQNLLVSWFDIGFLDLKRITWNEPASLLEKLIAYEAVHEIQSWDDLKNRLDIDRCCYAFFHPRMPDEPLIFVQVALVNELSGNIHVLLDDSAPVEDPENVDTAIFYSISNTQLGLRGVSLGDFLIKRVVDDLSRLFPNLKTFATLSPIPGFYSFLGKYLKSDETRLTNDKESRLLREIVETESAVDYQTLDESEEIRSLLMRMCAHYLTNEKRGKGASDSVANFHLTNGARIEQINWMGDHSEPGMKRSFGLMVNYFYKLSDIEKNHEAYVSNGDIKFSSQVKSLLKKNLE
jgi:malonyl-CoA decarboxylase